MSSDNQDKTVFRQPSASGDHTVIRPMPGGRPAAGQPQPPVSAAAVPTYSQAPASPQVDLQASYFRTTCGLNPLVNAASTLIAVFEKTHQSLSHPDVSGLYQRLVNEVRAFETRAKEQGIQPEIVLSSRYVLCTMLDEAVLNTPWGADSVWAQKTLLSTFHNETSGGEKFFLILERMRESPAENLYILELIYICLSLGYEGKYRMINRGRDMLEEIRDGLFRIIRTYRGEYERTLSPSWQGLGKIKNSLTQYIPMWVVASVTVGVMVLSYSGFRYWLHQASSPVAQQLTEIAKLRPTKTVKKYKMNN